jgi:hypothetical protein
MNHNKNPGHVEQGTRKAKEIETSNTRRDY